MDAENIEIIPDFPDDTLARLDGIAGEEGAQADAVEQEIADDAAKQQAALEQAQADGWRHAVGAARDLICSPFPEAEPTWTNERMDALASALARCDAAYGWGGVGGLFNHPLICLGLASFPLAIGTARAVNEARARKTSEAPPVVVADPMGAAVAPDMAPA